jgi:hypothetical protein
LIVRPVREVVHRCCNGQLRQAAPNVAVPLRVIVRVKPFGQVTAAARWSMLKSSAVKPPGTGARSGIGLMSASCPASMSVARAAPLP